MSDDYQHLTAEDRAAISSACATARAGHVATMREHADALEQKHYFGLAEALRMSAATLECERIRRGYVPHTDTSSPVDALRHDLSGADQDEVQMELDGGVVLTEASRRALQEIESGQLTHVGDVGRYVREAGE